MKSRVWLAHRLKNDYFPVHAPVVGRVKMINAEKTLQRGVTMFQRRVDQFNLSGFLIKFSKMKF